LAAEICLKPLGRASPDLLAVKKGREGRNGRGGEKGERKWLAGQGGEG